MLKIDEKTFEYAKNNNIIKITKNILLICNYFNNKKINE